MSAGRRRSGNTVQGPSSEDQALNQIASEAESRLAAKRAARAEARSIRMKELEKQQRELDEEYERQYQNEGTPSTKKPPAVRTLSSGNGTIENSNVEVDGPVDSEKTIKQLQDKLNELEEKYKKAMVTIAQLDNEKQALVYETEHLKDKLEDEEDGSTEARYELKEKNKEIERLKRMNKSLEKEIEQYKEALEYRDNFIAEKGLSLFEDTQHDSSVSEGDGEKSSSLLNDVGESNTSAEDKDYSDAVDSADRKASVSDDKEVLVDQIKSLQTQVAKMKIAGGGRDLEAPTATELEEIRREFGRQVNDMKIKVHKMEQENTRLEGLVMRLESQVKRYKSQAEAAESTEESLKADKRKLQRELRKAQDEIIELQTAHDHIQKRYEKLKNRRKDET